MPPRARPIVEEHQPSPGISSSAAAAEAAEAPNTSLYDTLTTDHELNPEGIYIHTLSLKKVDP